MEQKQTKEKKVLSLKDDLLALPSKPGEKAHLVGTHCRNCGEYLLGRRDVCPNCFSNNVEKVALSDRGKLTNFVVVRVNTPTWKGPVPYALGEVTLPEHVVVLAQIIGIPIEDVKVGQEMELAVEKAIEDEEGNDIMAFRWRPVSNKEVA